QSSTEMPDYHCNIDSVLLADVSNFSQDQNPVADEHAQVESIIDPAYPLPPSAPLETKGSRFENTFGAWGLTPGTATKPTLPP
ncbi:MAG: hypothetical protein Q9194_005735, partial [Teloschistes cf. exilis]